MHAKYIGWMVTGQGNPPNCSWSSWHSKMLVTVWMRAGKPYQLENTGSRRAGCMMC